jgi:hypothetical protein
MVWPHYDPARTCSPQYPSRALFKSAASSTTSVNPVGVVTFELRNKFGVLFDDSQLNLLLKMYAFSLQSFMNLAVDFTFCLPLTSVISLLTFCFISVRVGDPV